MSNGGVGARLKAECREDQLGRSGKASLEAKGLRNWIAELAYMGSG